MQAKVKASYAQTTVKAFTGRVYVKSEWRRVPDGHDAEAERLEAAGMLEYRQAPPALDAKPDATPAAEALAMLHDISLSSIAGTGTDGRIVIGDVRALIAVDEEE